MKSLILGGGFAGCSLAYFLKKKGYDVTLIEKHELGGLCRTYHYGGHPFEFGPHVFMSKDDMTDPVTKAFIDLTEGKYHYVDRALISYVEKDQKFYRYPIHFSDIERMPDKEQVEQELKEIRLEDGKLINPPQRGKNVSFAKYYGERLGKRLYDKFMRLYTLKMWGYSGEDMPTDTTFADQLRDKNEGKNVEEHDPLHFGEWESLAEGTFCVYPDGGYNPMFDKMVAGCEVRREEVIMVGKDSIITNGDSLWASQYDVIFNTLVPDEITIRKRELRAMGRILLPFIIPDKVMSNIETVYYPNISELQTRLTNMDRITGYEDVNTLLTLEVPIYPAEPFTTPHLLYAKNNNLFCVRAYPDRRRDQIDKVNELKEKFPKNTIHVGRLAKWQYQGMSEVMLDAYNEVSAL